MEYLKALKFIVLLNAFILVHASQENTSRAMENVEFANMVFILSLLLKRYKVALHAISMGFALEEISLHQRRDTNELV